MLLFLFLAASAWAQCANDTTANQQSDLDKLSSCTSFNGTLTIASGFSGATAQLSGVRSLNGDLRVNNATQLTSLSLPDLQTISGQFYLQSLTRLSSLSAPKLARVDTIEWITLPALSQLAFGTGVAEATSVSISDTGLQSLDGISLKQVSNFNLDNNRFLKQVNLDLKNVQESLTIAFNGKQVSASFPNLVWANNLTFRDVGSVSLPVLQNVNKSIAFVNNSISTLSVTNLTSVGADLALVSNTVLTNATFPALTQVGGGFQIANNTMLTNINGFNKLQSVGGAVDFSGTFMNATLPALNTVRGGFNLQTNQSFDCTQFQSLQSSGAIQGNGFTCSGQLNDPTTKDGSLTSQSSGTASGSSPSTSSSKAAAPHLVASGSVGVLGVIAALFL